MKHLIWLFSSIYFVWSAAAGAQGFELDWSQAGDSVSGILFEALKNRFQYGQQPTTRNGVEVCGRLLTTTYVGALKVKDASHEFTVETTGQAIGSFRLTVSQAEMPWTSQSDSVAAILFEALYDLAQTAPYSSWIQRQGSALVVEDNQVKLTCEAHTLGMAQVISYRCSFAEKNGAPKIPEVITTENPGRHYVLAITPWDYSPPSPEATVDYTALTTRFIDSDLKPFLARLPGGSDIRVSDQLAKLGLVVLTAPEGSKVTLTDLDGINQLRQRTFHQVMIEQDSTVHIQSLAAVTPEIIAATKAVFPSVRRGFFSVREVSEGNYTVSATTYTQIGPRISYFQAKRNEKGVWVISGAGAQG